MYIYVYLGSISSLMQILLNIIDIYAYIFSFGSVRIPVLPLSYTGGIDLGNVHSCTFLTQVQ